MKRSKSIISLLLVLVLVIGTFTGCASNNEKGKNNTIVVKDQIGREVTIPTKVEKVVSSYYISTSLLIALGVKDKVVGLEMKAESREIYRKAAPEFLELPQVGSGKGINVEETANLKPDVVIIPKKLSDSVEQFDKLNIPVLVVDPETMDNFLGCIDLISTVVGAENKGNELRSYYETKMNEVKEKTSKVTDRPKVYLSAGSDFLSTCTKEMYQNELIQMAGGTNVSSELTEGYWQTISAEQLLEWNPDYLFLVNYAEYSMDEVTGDVRFSELAAMKNNNVYYFPSKMEPWDYPTPSSILGVLWLTHVLHPEIITQADYVKEAKEFYTNFYNIEITDEELGL